MTDLVLMKTASGTLAPCDPEGAAYVSKMKLGQGIHGQFRKVRDLVHHRRMFALFGLAFDSWEPAVLEYKGQPVAKEFDRFRKDLTILAGHYNAVTSINGEVRLEAKSLSFGSMDDTEFETVYKSVLDATWKHVLGKMWGYTSPTNVDRVVNELLRFE